MFFCRHATCVFVVPYDSPRFLLKRQVAKNTRVAVRRLLSLLNLALQESTLLNKSEESAIN